MIIKDSTIEKIAKWFLRPSLARIKITICPIIITGLLFNIKLQGNYVDGRFWSEFGNSSPLAIIGVIFLFVFLILADMVESKRNRAQEIELKKLELSSQYNLPLPEEDKNVVKVIAESKEAKE